MDLSVIQKGTKDLSRTISKNSPTILTGLGVAGLVSTVVLAVKGTIKAQETLYQEAGFRRDSWSEQTGESEESYPIFPMFTTEETVELTWKCYIPTAVMGLTTIACMIGANSIHLRRNAALVSLFSITETALKEYQNKVVEKIGENKEAQIRGEIAQDKIDAVSKEDKAIILTGHGDYLCFDSFSGRRFRSNVEKIRRAENKFNQKLLREGWLSINEFYEELGLEPIDIGKEVGWIGQYALLDIRENVTLTPEGEPCFVMEYRVLPKQI